MIISEEVKRRYEAFWNRSETDRACVHIGLWDGSPGFKAPDNCVSQWEDIGERVERSVYEQQHIKYCCEGFPSVFTNFGPGCLAACIGGSYLPAPQTVWFENRPFFVNDWDNPPSPVLNEKSRMYEMIEGMTAGLLKHSDALCTSITDMGGTYDIIAALRGTENLLCDLYDNPDEVKAFRDKIAPIWKEYFLRYSSRLIAEQGCMSSWMPIWSDKSYYPLQCDFCAMISPEMFGEFILPDLDYQTSYMERSVYHLDGPGELPHVEQLLSLKRLNAVQWTSGDGNPPLEDSCWFDLYHRIQDAGKGLILFGVNPNRLEYLLNNISQRGVYMTMGVQDEKTAKEITDMMVKLNKQ